MAESTGISWCDATFNPWVGCSKVSPGCAHCYAETLVTGRMGRPGTWGEDGVRERTSLSTWAKPFRWAKLARQGLLPDGTENADGHRPRVFCASLADVFEDRDELHPWRVDLLDMIEATPELDWLILTKRPDWMRLWLAAEYANYIPGGPNPPANLWLGTSIENARHTWRADALREIPAAVRFISAEPLVGSLFEPDVQEGSAMPLRFKRRRPLDLTGIDWVIVGGESGGRDARPMHPAWAREIRDAVVWGDMTPCGDGCCEPPWPRPALHFKQWGSWQPNYGAPGDILVMPNGRRVDRMAADAYAIETDGAQFMRYAGVSPKSAGKLLDGVDWCEFPEVSVAV